MNIVHALVTCAIAIVVTFALTWILGFEDPVEEQDTAVTASLSGDEQQIFSPLSGQLVALDQVNDDVFSQGLLGQGVAIRPQEGLLRAPLDGEVVTFLPSMHAVGIKGDNGVELLVHIGIDTVNLAGQHFSSNLQIGDRVKMGDELVRFDLAAIAGLGYDLTTPVLVVNSEAFPQLSCRQPGRVGFGEPIISLNNTQQEQA
jgi:PTS system beta-glucosides-specific IIC component